MEPLQAPRNKAMRKPLELPEIDPIVRFKDVGNVIGCGRSTTYALIRSGLLSPPIKLGPRACGWRASTLRAFIDAREAQGLQGAAS